MSLKDDILANPFVYKLRLELKVDRQAFDLLCNQLRALAVEWSAQRVVDKRLIQDLYAYPQVIFGVADSFRSHRPDLAAEISEMAVVIDGLILEALDT